MLALGGGGWGGGGGFNSENVKSHNNWFAPFHPSTDRQIDRQNLKATDRQTDSLKATKINKTNNVQWLKCSAPVACKSLNFKSSISVFSSDCLQFSWELNESTE